MKPIDGLLRKAGELNDAGMKEFNPALEAVAAVQASMAEALAPIFEVLAGLQVAEPVSYGFVLPAEPPAIKADQGETSRSPDRAEVTLGPINVYAITKEIQKALENVGRDSMDVPAVYATYTGPVALPSPISGEPERRQDLTREVQMPRQPVLPDRDPVTRGKTPVMPTAPGEDRLDSPAMAKPPTEQWVRQSIRRSNVVMSDLSEIHRQITEKTITAERVREISTDSLAIGASVAAGPGQSISEKPLVPEEPPRATFTYTPPMAPERRTTGTAPSLPPQRESRDSQPQQFIEAPPTRLRQKIVTPAEEADFNARRLTGARSVSAESTKPSGITGEPTSGIKESHARIVWPVVRTPEERESRVPDAPSQGDIRQGSVAGTTRPREVRQIDPWLANSPVTEVVRSFGAMDEYVRVVSEMGSIAGIAGGAGIVSPGSRAGISIVNAMAGVSAVTQPVMQGGPQAEIENLFNRSYPAPPEVLSPVVTGIAGTPAVIAPSGASAAGSTTHSMVGLRAIRGSMPTMGLSAGIAAAQVSQRSGASMIQHLIQSAPQVTGTVIPQVSSIYDAGRGLPFAAPGSPAAASGAENIVNISMPSATAGRANESNTTNKVSSFHNTFNITVNVKSGEERELKDLGKKIGQILSEEIKRYGGI